MNRPALFLIAVILEACVVSITATGQSYDRPRFTMPRDGHPGSIDFEQYVAMEDPVVAGHLLLVEAKKVGLDLDDSSRVLAPTDVIKVPGGYVRSAEAYGYLRRVRAGTQTNAKELGAYVVKVRRPPTIRELSAAMVSGIHLSRQLFEGGLVMAMRGDQVAGVSLLPYVKWVHPFLPEFKYLPHSVFERKPNNGFNASIETIGGDRVDWRQDLKRCGGAADGVLSPDGLFVATIPPDSVDCIARLWWVLYIEPAAETENQ